MESRITRYQIFRQAGIGSVDERHKKFHLSLVRFD
jgi:hypothetical protein